METGPQLKVSSDRLVKPGIEPGTPGLQGKRFIHYTTAAPITIVGILTFFGMINFMFIELSMKKSFISLGHDLLS